MTIEFLYPELCNLYGDRGNMDYLRRCLPADTRQTYMGDEPWFVQHEVDLIYMCSMTERSQERIIQALAPYRERLKDLMAGGTHFLLTGNAMEVFGKTIRDGEKTISGLGLLDLTARRILPRRANSLFWAALRARRSWATPAASAIWRVRCRRCSPWKRAWAAARAQRWRESAPAACWAPICWGRCWC